MSQMHRPNPYDPHRGSEPPDPNERLTQLKIELQQHQDRLDDLGKQKDELQADVNDLEKTVAEVKSTLTDYGGQVKGLETNLHSLQYFYDQKHKMIIAAIGDKKGPIDELIREFDYETSRMQDRLAELADKLSMAQQESQRATIAQNAKQADYDAVKAYTQNTQAKLSDLDTLRTAITQDDTATDIASMYFHVLEFQDVLSGTNILSQHQLALELRQTLGELEQAKEHARVKSAEANRLQTEYNAQQATLSARVAGRRQTLLGLIQAMYPVPAQQPSSAASGTTTSATAGTSTTSGAPASSASPSIQKK